MPLHNPSVTARTRRSYNFADIDELISQAIEIAIDTEFQGPQTLTVQAACRLSDRMRVKIYRSTLVPEMPKDFRLQDYIPKLESGCRRLNGRIVQKPTGLISAAMSPGNRSRAGE